MKTHVPEGLDESGLPRCTPFAIRCVSETQFSIARFFGTMRFNGQAYTYFQDTDELVRDDVLRWVMKRKVAVLDHVIKSKIDAAQCQLGLPLANGGAIGSE